MKASPTTVVDSIDRRNPILAASFLAFASGAVALIYEVLWTRQFVSLFGATAPAISATLSVLFLGLAIGNATIGKRAVRWSRPLRGYGILEMGIGLTAILVLPLLGLYEHLYPLLYAQFSGSSLVFLVVKMSLAAIALLPPSFLMGGTLPLLAQALVSRPEKLGRIGSAVYATNNLGATFGALSVPFYLLPIFGVHWSYVSVVAASLLIGAAAIWLDHRSPSLGSDQENLRSKPGTLRISPPGISVWLPRSLAFLSGVLVLALEVVWTRMLAQVHENSIYSFALVLAVFLMGLASGAALARFFLQKQWKPRAILGLAWISSGVLVFGSPQLFYFLTEGLSYVNKFGPPANLVTLGFALATMFLPTLLAGMILPLLMEITGAGQSGSAGSLLGTLLAINTAGAVIGPLLATYVLPGLGLWVGIAVIGLIMILAGEIALQGLFRRSLATTRQAAVLVLLTALLVSQNPFTLPRAQAKKDHHERVIHVDEGSHGIVAVLESPGDRWMLLNNFYALGGTASAVEERQQGRIPLLLHPGPRKVAFLGLGTGITAGGALLPGVQKVVALEFVPEVVAVAREYFAEANLGLLKDPKVEVIHEDARIFLKTAGRDFDVIVGDLVVPWRSGESALFTEEHFATARAALAPGGIFCQWLPMYQLSEEQFRIIAATFLDVFPSTTLWRGDFFPDSPALALVGHTDVKELDAQAIDQKVEQLKPVFRPTTPILSEPGGLWMFLVGALNPGDPQFAQARRNRESEPWIELLSPATSLKATHPGFSLFVGRELYRFMESIRANPMDRSPLRNLAASYLHWRDSGALLWEAALLQGEGHETEANQRAAQGLALLPDGLRVLIGGGASQK